MTDEEVVWVPKQQPNKDALGMPIFVLVSGWKTSGKDTVCMSLQSGTFKHEWCVFVPQEAGTGNTKDFEWLEANALCAPIERFAKTIRVLLATRFKLPADYDWDAKKDVDVFDGKLLREHMKELGSYGRTIEPGYWAKMLLKQYKHTNKNIKVVLVADNRFLDEIDACKRVTEVYTVRVFREDVPVPPLTDRTEHGLDNCLADFLLVPTMQQFQKLCQILPGYSKYQIACRTCMPLSDYEAYA